MTDSTVFVSVDTWANEAAPTVVNATTRRLKLDGNSGGTARKRAFLLFKLPFAPKDDVAISSATLRLHLAGAWAGGPHTVTARRIDVEWSARTLRWANQPTVTGASPTVAVTGGSDGDVIEIDVTSLISAVATGSAEWWGIRLELDTSGPLAVYSREARTLGWRPRLEVVWTDIPDAPEDLSPAGGRAVSKAKPHLGWHDPGARGETTQAKARVKVSTSASDADITFDTGLITLLESEIDLSDATYAAPTIADAADRYWAVMYEDDQGRQSPFSNWVHFVRHAQGTLTIDSPTDGAVIDDVGPTVLLSYSGAPTLESVALYLEKLDDDGKTWLEIWRRPRKKTTDLSISIPAGYIRRTNDNYRIRARGWDTYDREWRPGDPPFVEDIVEFTWERDPTVDPVDDITVTQHADGSPLVDIVISDSVAPDYYSLSVGGDRIRTRIEPEDVVSGVGEYTIVYDAARPGFAESYEVERVSLVSGRFRHSQDNPTDTFASSPVGIWLWDPDDPDNSVVLRSGAGGDLDWGETAVTLTPTGSRGKQEAPVRYVQSTRGREGSVHGIMRDLDGTKARTFLARLRAIWRNGTRVRLVAGEYSLPVVIGEPHETLIDEPTPAYGIELAVWQVDDLDR